MKGTEDECCGDRRRGLIGSNFLLDLFRHHDKTVINVDKLTYADNLENLASCKEIRDISLFEGTSAIVPL